MTADRILNKELHSSFFLSSEQLLSITHHFYPLYSKILSTLLNLYVLNECMNVTLDAQINE